MFPVLITFIHLYDIPSATIIYVTKWIKKITKYDIFHEQQY